MKYNQIKELKGEKFRRLTGVKSESFLKIVVILREADKKRSLEEGERTSLV